MKIITVSREFGSGGREVGKRLADEMGIAYYDKEILTAISEKIKMDADYIQKKLESGFSHTIPLTFGRTINSIGQRMDVVNMMIEQQKVIKGIAEKGEDFVIVGRNADIILKNYHPFNIFVYADIKSRIERSMGRNEAENLSEKELVKYIKQIDSNRRKSRELISNTKWGEKSNYDLCINTSDVTIKTIIPCIADYIKATSGGKK